MCYNLDTSKGEREKEMGRYDMAKVKKVKDGYQATCEICGKLKVWEWEDDALDEGAEHDSRHGYDDREGE